MTIFYVYNRSTGEYAGNGTTVYDNDQYGCTEIACPSFTDSEVPIFNEEKWVISPKDNNLAYQRQFRLALVRDGISLIDIENAIKSLPAQLSAEALIEWEYALVIDKNNALVAQIAQILGYDNNKIDSIFSIARRL